MAITILISKIPTHKAKRSIYIPNNWHAIYKIIICMADNLLCLQFDFKHFYIMNTQWKSPLLLHSFMFCWLVPWNFPYNICKNKSIMKPSGRKWRKNTIFEKLSWQWNRWHVRTTPLTKPFSLRKEEICIKKIMTTYYQTQWGHILIYNWNTLKIHSHEYFRQKLGPFNPVEHHPL